MALFKVQFAALECARRAAMWHSEGLPAGTGASSPQAPGSKLAGILVAVSDTGRVARGRRGWGAFLGPLPGRGSEGGVVGRPGVGP
jgi:hypothetical protein